MVTEQNSEKKQPKREQAVLVAEGGSTEEEQVGLGKPMAELFCLDRNL
jgi:hypothetical protein